MRSLVIGAEGFVGGHLIQHLAECGDEVFCGTYSSQGSRGHQSVQLDITDPKSVAVALEASNPDVVYHLAGISFVPEAEEDFQKALRVNVGGTANVVRECHRRGGVIMVFVSSGEVYGAITSKELPVTEQTPIRPMNNYSLSKRMAELVVERYSGLSTVKCAIARPFNHIGPGQNERFVTANFALQLARIAHGRVPATLRVGNLDARRDFSDVRDIVRAYRMLALSEGGVFNLGSGRAVSIQFLLDTLVAISGLEVIVERDPSRMRGPEVPEVYGSHSHVSHQCGWHPEITIQRSLEDVYRYWFDLVAKGAA